MSSNQNEWLDLFRTMLLIRRFEEKAAEMYALGKIGGFCHLYIGEEAVAVGAVSSLGPEDYVISFYREHGHCLARGSEPKRVMAELFGKSTGLSGGRGGSMHLFDAERNFMGGYAIVGGHLPLAAGLGFAIKYKATDQVVLCFLGDGSVPTGIFHESLNMAALWKLPVIFICENNRYGMGTPVERASAIYDIARIAGSYDMPYETIDGMDVLAVRSRVQAAVDKVRREQIPFFIEARTYRFLGHSMSDPAHGHYRTKEELDHQKKRDPIALFEDRLTREKILSDGIRKEIENKVDGIIREAVEFSSASPEPPPGSLFENLYA
jgi:pyruvate dehydrogenase E1 component subunit alpha